jgi:hypothetical protein
LSFEVEEGVPTPPAEPRRTRKPKGPEELLFPMPEVERVAPSRLDWIEALFESQTYKAQKKLVGRAAPRDSEVERFLTALQERGGKLTRNALAVRLGHAPVRLGGWIAVVRRLVNVDGYAVLSVDPVSDTVELNLELLRKQFEIESDD